MSYEGVNWWVSNPLILLIVGAGLSGLVIPSITRKWQDHQTELDLKVQLVDRLSESVTSIVMATEFASSMDEKMRNDILEYHKGCYYITARIEAYFYQSSNPIADEWRKYDEVIQDFYRLPDESAKTSDLIIHIQMFVEPYQKEKRISIDWKALKTPYKGNSQTKNQAQAKEMAKLIPILFDIKHKLMRDIMNSDITVFNQGLLKKVIQKFNRSSKQSEIVPSSRDRRDMAENPIDSVATTSPLKE